MVGLVLGMEEVELKLTQQANITRLEGAGGGEQNGPQQPTAGVSAGKRNQTCQRKDVQHGIDR